MKKTLVTLASLFLFANYAFADCVFYKPIEIKELTIGNFVSWSTISEYGNLKFIVEKSQDGIDFEAIGELDGAGDSQDVQDYRFLDLKTGADQSYYRLKMIDVSEYESLSHTIFFNRKNSNNYIFRSMSSPFTDSHFTLVLESKLTGKMRYRIVDQRGDVLLSKTTNIALGANMININLTDLPIGTYKMETTLKGEKEMINIRRVKTENLPNIQYVIK